MHSIALHFLPLVKSHFVYKYMQPLTIPIWLFQYKTDIIPMIKTPVNTGHPNFVYLMPHEDNPKGRTVLLELTPPPDIEHKTRPGSSQQMNVLGIVIFSATMGKTSAFT